MKIQSSDYPSKFFKHQNRIFINDLSTIEEVTEDDTTTYSYEHYPLNISDRVDLVQYVESNYTMLLNKAKQDFETERTRKALQPSPGELEKSKREIETIELLMELGVL
jgi:hypothetical protein